jgi:LmbE family N-acetylglucosaminyl deacetylase
MIAAGDWLRLAEACLPLVSDPVTIVGQGDVLILAPHPDDEALGCGGLIAALSAIRRPPMVVVLTDGSGSHPGSAAYPPPHLAALRRKETAAAAEALGLPADRLMFLELPDGGAAGQVMRAAERLAELPRPGAILATWGHDPHPDHVAAAAIAQQLGTLLGPPAPRLLAYPVWGLGFAHTLPRFPIPPAPHLSRPPRGLRLDIAAHLPAKRRAIAAHASQVTSLITDVPDGFRIPAELLALAHRPFELFLDA